MLLRDRFDGKALRRFAPLRPLPHPGIGGLDVAGEALRIEERAATAIIRELGPE